LAFFALYLPNLLCVSILCWIGRAFLIFSYCQFKLFSSFFTELLFDFFPWYCHFKALIVSECTLYHMINVQLPFEVRTQNIFFLCLPRITFINSSRTCKIHAFTLSFKSPDTPQVAVHTTAGNNFLRYSANLFSKFAFLLAKLKHATKEVFILHTCDYLHTLNKYGRKQ
jgi:hypothetical protein